MGRAFTAHRVRRYITMRGIAGIVWVAGVTPAAAGGPAAAAGTTRQQACQSVRSAPPKTEARPWTSGTGFHEPSNDEPPVTVAHRLDATLGCRKRLGRRPRLFGNAQKCCARLGRRAAPQLPRFGILEPMRAKPRQAWEARALPAELSPRGTDTRASSSTLLAVKPAKP